MQILLTSAGAFTIALGVVHFFMPLLFDFENAIPPTGNKLRPFRLLFYTYDTRRSDVQGIAWVMNHAVSFTLVSIGVVDLMAREWLAHEWATIIAGWIAVWWFLRAGCQFYLGRRSGDWYVVAFFSLLGALHIWASLGITT